MKEGWVCGGGGGEIEKFSLKERVQEQKMIKAVACVFPSLLVPRPVLWTGTLPARLEKKGERRSRRRSPGAEEEAQRGFLDDADDYLCTLCTWVARTGCGDQRVIQQ